MILDGFQQKPEVVYQLIKSVYNSTDAFAADFEQEYPSPHALTDRLEAMKRRPGSLFLVACEDDELLGFLFITPRPAAKLWHTADLNMGVCEEARGKGIGRQLVNEALSRLQQQRIIEILYLMVRADNRPAIRLYQSHGFHTLATLPHDTRIGTRYYDGLLMSRRIP